MLKCFSSPSWLSALESPSVSLSSAHMEKSHLHHAHCLRACVNQFCERKTRLGLRTSRQIGSQMHEILPYVQRYRTKRRVFSVTFSDAVNLVTNFAASVCFWFWSGCNTASQLRFTIVSYSVHSTLRSNLIRQPLFWRLNSMDILASK